MEYLIKKNHKLVGEVEVCPQMDNISTIMEFIIEDERLWDKDVYLEFKVGKKGREYMTDKISSSEGKFQYALPNGVLLDDYFFMDIVFRGENEFVWKTYTKQFFVRDALLVSQGEAPIIYPDYVGKFEEELNEKQDTLVSGVNIKTINNESIMEKGNINVTTIDIDIMVDRNDNNYLDGPTFILPMGIHINPFEPIRMELYDDSENLLATMYVDNIYYANSHMNEYCTFMKSTTYDIAGTLALSEAYYEFSLNNIGANTDYFSFCEGEKGYGSIYANTARVRIIATQPDKYVAGCTVEL